MGSRTNVMVALVVSGLVVTANAAAAWPAPAGDLSGRPGAAAAHVATAAGESTSFTTAQVRALQRALIKAGHGIPAGVTGYYGPQTTRAVAAFQRAQGWSGSDSDGVAGPTTLRRLGVSAATTTPASAPGATTTNSPAGLSKATTKELQRRLIRRGHGIPSGATGWYGPETTRAVMAFQRAQGWSGSDADGIAGPGTLRRLGMKNAASETSSTTSAASPSAGSSGPGVHVVVSGPLTRTDVPYSYREGCPVAPSDLRRLSLNYWNYNGSLARGALIVRADVVDDLTHVFTRAFNAGFRIKAMVPVDAFYDRGKRSPADSDFAAMAAGNTSAFNCRPVTGNPTRLSNHSYGIAIDINPFENPYVIGSTYYPRRAGEYVTRTPCRRGMICTGGVVATAMATAGWSWGGRWARPDYQHFSADGR